jgi:hypothetical protein
MVGGQQFYSEDEAQQILQIAAKKSLSDGMSRDELVRAAAELGISESEILKAEHEVQSQRDELMRQQEEFQLKKEFRIYRRRRVLDKIWSFVSANSLFVFIWFFTGMGYFWPIWVFGFWGVTLIGGILQELLNPAETERLYAKWLARKQKTQAALTMPAAPGE